MSGENEVLLRTRGLAARAGGRLLFRDLDLELHRGELTSVTGPNGAGKSTLLRLLLGLARPAAGSVERARGIGLGYVPQLDPGDPGLPFPARSIVLQGFPGPHLNVLGTRERGRAATAALARAGFRSPMSRRYGVLSGGERRRVLLARALVARPHLLVLDEPTAGVDQAGQAEFAELVLSEVRGRGMGAVWVCHGVKEVENAADRVLRLGADA